MTSKLRLALASLLLGSALSAPGFAAEPTPYRFTPESTVTYHVIHPMHHVVGVSHQLSGEPRVTAGPDLAMPLRLSVPIRSFDSGNRNRDRNMLQVMHVSRYPQAVLEIQSVTWASKRTEGTKTTAEGTAKGSLTLNGTTRPVDITLSGFVDGARMEVDARFSFLLSEFGVERPSLLFRPVDDEVKLEVKGIAVRP